MKAKFNRRALCAASYGAAVGLAVLAGNSNGAWAGPRGIIYANRFKELMGTLDRADSIVASRKKLQYYGGPVVSSVKSYAVFWGPRVDATTVSQIGGMLTATVNSTYMDWLAEYNTAGVSVDGRAGTQQKIERGSYLGQWTIQPANTRTALDDSDIQAELGLQIQGGTLPEPDADTVYMVYFPPGVSIKLDGQASCEVFCGYHNDFALSGSRSVFYGVMPDLGGACEFGCGDSASSFDNLTAVTSHELIEAITDPQAAPGSHVGYPNGWCTSDGQEIGDPCGGTTTQLSTPELTYILQQEFDNATGKCAPGPYRSP